MCLFIVFFFVRFILDLWLLLWYLSFPFVYNINRYPAKTIVKHVWIWIKWHIETNHITISTFKYTDKTAHIYTKHWTANSKIDKKNQLSITSLSKQASTVMNRHTQSKFHTTGNRTQSEKILKWCWYLKYWNIKTCR